ncbi:MAG: hypothetical protein KAX38_05950 [Candidatus Krumholzibacteria bacterium]|nr:hypothetical protein [Candidatus Krumholzibacteria bacterium]
MMVRYHHRQLGILVLWIGCAALIGFIALLVFVEAPPIGIAVLLCLLVCFILFGALTVEVTDTEVHLRFGPGLIRKSFSISDIRRVEVVRNAWYFGWGIRRIPRGWLYNVSGLNAIELEMSDGHLNRIGTDQPEELLAAIEKVRRKLGN